MDGLLAASFAQIGIQQNTDMRRISAAAAILAIPTLIAGIYGMNFDHMPELHWTFGYPPDDQRHGGHLVRRLPGLPP